MNAIKSVVSFVADVGVCLLFAVLVLVAWPWVESLGDFKAGGAK